MSLSDFFAPITIPQANSLRGEFYNSQFGHIIRAFVSEFPSWDDESKPDIALVGVEEDRAAVGNNGSAKAPDAVRKHFYNLYQGDYTVNIVDLGNIKAGKQVSDTYAALKLVVEELVKQDIVPVIIGGGQDLTYAQYRGYENLEQRVELAVIDSRFDLDQDNDETTTLDSQTYLNKIILHEPDYLFNLSNVAYQTYLV